MSELLDSTIKDIKKRLRDKDPTAVERAAKLSEDYPDEPKVWRLLAFARSLNDDMDGGAIAIIRVVASTAPSKSLFRERAYATKRQTAGSSG